MFQDIQKVTETEQETRTKKTGAQAEAKQIVAAAKKAGEAAVNEARAKAEEQVRALMAQAEKLAGEEITARWYSRDELREMVQHETFGSWAQAYTYMWTIGF